MERPKIYEMQAGIRKTRATQGLRSIAVDPQKNGGQTIAGVGPLLLHIG